MSAPQTDAPNRRLLILIAAASALAIAVIAALLSNAGREESAAVASEFEPVYEALEQRREQAGVSTMGDPADADAHLHPNLTLFADGKRIPVPVNIGIDPADPPEEMASLHTHETDGTIHVEGMSEATLGQFFEVWGVPFSEAKLGPYEAGGDKSIRMWVDGEPSDEFEQLKLADSQEIVVAFGTPDQLEVATP